MQILNLSRLCVEHVSTRVSLWGGGHLAERTSPKGAAELRAERVPRRRDNHVSCTL